MMTRKFILSMFMLMFCSMAFGQNRTNAELCDEGDVAKIGEVYYETLDEAITAAQDGDEIKVLRNSTGAGVLINKNITIDFGGYTYTFNKAYKTTAYGLYLVNVFSSKDIKLKNGTLTSTETSEGKQVEVLVMNYLNLTLEDMNIVDATDHIEYALSLNSGETNIIGETSITSDAIAFDAYDYSEYFELPVVNVNTTGTIAGGIEVSATLNIIAADLTDDSYIVLHGNGQLFHNGITTTIKKNIEGTTTGWNTISTPIVGGSEIATTIPEADKHELYRYDETEQQWEWVADIDNAYERLDSGRGYLYANTDDTELSFKGELNNDDITYELSHTENQALSGFNLIGNPFTHKITEAHLTTASLAEGFYTISDEGAWVPNTTGTIAPMQAFLVKTDGANTDLIIKKIAAETRKADNGELEITVYNNNYKDVAYVSFNEGFGLNKINHRNSDIPMICVPVDGEDYAVAVMDRDVTEIPVSFKATTMGEYTLGVKANNCEFSTMYLVDKLTGAETDLLNDEYTFIATSKDDANRFVIKFAMEPESVNDNNFIYISNDEMIINSIEGNGVLRVYDVTGRSIANYNVYESARISTSAFDNGVYLIQMSDDSGIKVQKIIIE